MPLRVAWTINDGETSSATSISAAVPATVQAGDVLAVVSVQNTGTATHTITGGGAASWNLRSGPDDNLTQQRTYVWTKTAGADSAGATVTITSTASGTRFIGAGLAASGRTEAGVLVQVTTDTTSGTALAWPSVTIPDNTGWELYSLATLRAPISGGGPTITTAPSGSSVDATAQTVFSTSPNFSANALHKTSTVASGSQSFGSGTASISVTANLYTIGLAVTSTASGGITLGGSVSGSAVATAAGTFSLSGSALESNSPAITAAGTVSLAGSATAKAAATAAGSISLSGTATENRGYGFGQQAFGTSPFGTGGPAFSPLMATPEPNSVPPRIRLDVTTSASWVTIYRVSADGTKSVVRTYDGGPLPVPGASTFIYDPEPPYQEPITYITDTGLSSGAVILDVPNVWLVHPAVPARSVQLDLVSVSDRTSVANLSVRYPLGRSFPIVAGDGVRKAPSYTLVLRTSGAAAAAALDAILADLSPLLLNVPASSGWIDPARNYIAAGDLTRSNPGVKGYVTDRYWSLPCSVVDRPAGGTQAFNTYGYSKSLYPTYAARKAAAATYGAAFDIN